VNAYAGIVTRTLALAIDALVLNVGIAVVTTIVGLALSVFGESLADPETPALLGAVAGWALVTGAYFAGFWTLAGQTPGMRVLRLEVSCTDGAQLRVGRALRRLIAMVLAALPLMAGYGLILVDGRRQGLHDKVAGTVVRYAPRAEALPYVRSTSGRALSP
jgi:uncharacterized RDD family membrane protein YckC